MAETFDANVPQEQDPNWLFFSREARETPQGNRGNLLLSESAGKALDIGATELNKLQEEHVQNTVFDIEQRNRDQFINTAQNLADDKGVQHPLNVLSQDNLANAPPEVKQAISRVQTVTAAAQGGRADKWTYFRNVIPELQSVREQYPGYRHIVDQALGNNANAYMNTLIQEINRKDSENRADVRHQQSEVMSMFKEGFFGPSGASVVDAFNNGKLNFSQVLQASAPYARQAYLAKAAQQNEAIHNWDQTQKLDNVTDVATKQTAMIANQAVVMPALAAGHLSPLGQSPTGQEDINSLMRMAAENKVDPEKAMAIRQRLQASYNQAYSQAWNWFNTPWANGETPLKIMGEAKVKSLIEGQLSGLQGWLNWVGDAKTYPLADTLKNQMRFQQEGDYLHATAMTGDPQHDATANLLRNGKVVEQSMGGQALGVALPLLPKMPENLASFLQSRAVTAMGGQPDTNGNQPSLGEEVKWLKDHGVDVPQAYMSKINWISDLGNKHSSLYSPEIQKHILSYAYGANNRDFMSNFTSGHYARGQWRPGAEDAFQAMYNDRMTHKVMQFADPKLSNDYQNSAEANFRYLATRNIKTLNDVVSELGSLKQSDVITDRRNPGQKTTVGETPKTLLGWNTDTNSYQLTPEAERYLTKTQQITGVQEALSRLRMLTNPMAGILQTVNSTSETQHPRDIRTYMIRLFQSSGFDIKDMPILQELHDSIATTAKQPKPKKTSEDKVGNL